MKKILTVKARSHHGSNSLDITIPVVIRKENNINVGDVFSIKVKNEQGKLQLIYSRVFNQTDK